jgi:hypothetical protein
MIFVIYAIRATCSLDRGGHPFVLQIGGSDLGHPAADRHSSGASNAGRGR